MPNPQPSHVLHHKDVSPTDTIARIHRTLGQVGITLKQTHWWSLSDQCYSVRVGVETMPNSTPVIGQNGKGRTHELALASAYAEVMERLQNGIFLPKGFGLMPDRLADPPDAVSLTPNQLWSSSESLRRVIFAEGVTKNDLNSEDTILTVPFVNATKGTIEHIPSELLGNSNGMCAGNSPEEALVQGLCEILERRMLAKMLFEGTRLPTIPEEELTELGCYEIIEHLKEKGYRVLVKDCTEGGKFPVAAVVLFDPQGVRCGVHLGCDPILDVTLQRCLTEMFQGISRPDETLSALDWDIAERKGATASLTDQHYQLFASHMGGAKDVFPNSLLISSGKPEHSGAFMQTGTSNRDMLNELIRRLADDGHDVFVRDVSFLSFPTYKVFVPSMLYMGARPQPVWPRNDRRQATQHKDVIESLLTLETKSIDEIESLAALIEKRFATPTESLFPIRTDGTDAFSSLHQTDFLLAVMYCAAGNYTKGAQWLQRYIERAKTSTAVKITNHEYAACVLVALKLKAEGMDETRLGQVLTELFGEQLTAAALPDIPGPDKGGFTNPVPNCGDCAKCSIQTVCYYEPWRGIVAKLNEAMKQNPIEQRGLAKLFVY